MFSTIKNKLLAVVTITLMVGACRDAKKYPGYEYFPEMYRGPAYETYAPANNMDSTSAMLPVDGTVPRGYMPFNYGPDSTGYRLAGANAINPLTNDSINITEGKRLYEIYCINCHGSEGKADGSIVAAGKFPPPPSYSTGTSSRGGRMADLTDGKIYHTITYGLNLMGSHAGQLNPKQRWQIVMYVHELQKIGQPTASAAMADSSTKK